MNKTILHYSLAALIAIFLGCYFRLYPILFPISSESEQKAVAMIVTQVRTNIASNIERLYPGLDETRKYSLVNEKFQEWSHNNKDRFQKLIFNLAQKIYRQDRLANPLQKAPELYLPDSDSYYFYGLTKQLIDGQKIMQQRKGAEYFNSMMLAPVGYWEKINYHPYIGFLVHKMIRSINPNISDMAAISFTPIILMVLSVILFVFCCRGLLIPPLATAIGAICFTLAPIFLRRSFFGWYDNDPYNVFFPLLIISLTFAGLDHSRSSLRRNFFAVMVALSIGIYAFFWQGWVYIFCVLLAAGMAIAAAQAFFQRERNGLKEPALFFGGILIVTFISIIASFGIGQFFFLFKEGWSVLNEFFSSSSLSLWPDIYLSVGELHRASVPELIGLCGNISLVLIVFLGLFYIALDVIRNFSIKTSGKTIILIVFLLSSLVLAIKAQRFAILFLVPFLLCAAYGLQKAFDGIRRSIEKFFPWPGKRVARLSALAMVSAIFLADPILKADDLAMRIRPIFNEEWDRALSTLKKNTPQNSIINTWWSPGHFIKAMAQRRVTFDGATINVPQAYWMAQALYASDERYMLGVLRMLNTSANKATEYLLSQGLELSKSIELIKRIVILSSSDSTKLLTNYLAPDQIKHLLTLTHGNPAPSYVFLYNDLMETNIGIGFAARWNIQKIEEINKDPNLLRQVKQMKHQDFIDLLWRMQGGMLRYGEVFNQIGQQNGTILFDNGIVIDIASKTCHISSQVFGVGIPRALVYESGQAVIKKEFLDANLTYAVVLFSSGPGRYSCVLMDEVIADSMLVKLYFFNGKGLRYVTPFLDEHDLLGRTQIFAFQLNWATLENDLKTP